MRFAILSDIHGNPLALEAVLADVEALGGADAYWVLGDFAAIGYAPVAAIERVNALPNLRVVRGNTDRYLISGERPPPSVEDATRDPALTARLLEVAQSFAWTLGALSATRWLDWLAALPVEDRLTLTDGTRVLLVHASPGTDDGPGIAPNATEEELRSRFGGADADLVFVGHTHWPADRRVDEVRVVNLGAVSNSWLPGAIASYVVLDADANGHTLQHRRVDYDHAAVIAALEAVRHPAGEFIRRFQSGEARPPWEQAEIRR